MHATYYLVAYPLDLSCCAFLFQLTLSFCERTYDYQSLKCSVNLSKRLKEHKTNCEKAELDKSAVAKHAWTYDHRIKWDEANILAIDSHRFSRKMRESIEIELEKHNTIDQEGKPLNSTWRALFNVQN